MKIQTKFNIGDIVFQNLDNKHLPAVVLSCVVVKVLIIKSIHYDDNGIQYKCIEFHQSQYAPEEDEPELFIIHESNLLNINQIPSLFQEYRQEHNEE